MKIMNIVTGGREYKFECHEDSTQDEQDIAVKTIFKVSYLSMVDINGIKIYFGQSAIENMVIKFTDEDSPK